MGPVRLNRRRFLGASAAAGIALSQGVPVEAGGEPRRVRLGLVGAGNRGTALLRSLLELPAVEIAAVADSEARHRHRASGIIEKATKQRPSLHEEAGDLLARDEIDAVLLAVPCDLHAVLSLAVLRAGKHLYAEKPLAPSLAECDAVIDEAARHPDRVVHVGFQRRSNPRYQQGVELIRRGELGTIVGVRGSWTSSNGPVLGHGGWLGRRARSGDWMVEQAVHVWDVLQWALGGSPLWATGQGRRDVFAATHPDRDVTDHYSAMLGWPGSIPVTFTHSWVDPPDDAFTGTTLQVVGTEGALDLGSGTARFRNSTAIEPRKRLSLQPGAVPDTKLALSAFLDAIRADEPPAPPITLAEAREATRIGLLVRQAVDQARGRVVSIDEVEAAPGGFSV
jgi:myo-inositol 2-dehydrogenase/D-chiro-inositol 1-dehydrogenase